MSICSHIIAGERYIAVYNERMFDHVQSLMACYLYLCIICRPAHYPKRHASNAKMPTLTALAKIHCLQLRLRPLVQEILHLKPRPVGVKRGSRPLAVPCPLLLVVWPQFTLQHLNNVLAEHREELVAVERTTCGDEKALCCGMGRNDEIGACCESVPGCNVSTYGGIGERKDLPADTVLVHLPGRTILAVEHIVRVVNV
jgi:hypothetical protein